MNLTIRVNNKIVIKRIFVFLLLCVFSFSIVEVTQAQLGKGGAAGSATTAVSKIITGTSVRVRASSSTSSKEVTQLNFGTIIKSSGRSSNKDKVGDKEDYWYKITTSDGKSGWVFGGFLESFDDKRRDIIYLNISSDRLKNESADFDDFSDLLNFLTRITPQITEQNNVATLEFYKLQALAKALEKMPFDKLNQAPYKTFTDKQNAKIVYSEPSGQWLVRAELFWDLSKRYRALPIADEIAWAAANTFLPGEGEGYLPIYIYLTRVTHGEYLKLYPNGRYAREALQQITEYLAPIVDDLSQKQVYTGPADASERAEMNKHLSELHSIVSKTTDSATKSKVLNQVEQISKAFP